MLSGSRGGEMSDTPEFVVEDARNALLKLRTDLIIAPRTGGEWSGYFIEDPLRGKFFRLGLAEHAVLSLLDGQRTISQACAEAAVYAWADRFERPRLVGALSMGAGSSIGPAGQSG